MASKLDFVDKKCLVVVTGASQGIGRTIAVQLSRLLGTGSILLLIARSEKGLYETRTLIQEATNSVGVVVQPLDLTSPTYEQLEGVFDVVDQPDNFEVALIFHNVGHIGTLDITTNLTNMQAWRDYFDLNVFSVAILNAVFVKKLKGSVPRLGVINITSLCGRQPFANMAMYGSGKAARELYFRVFSVEEPQVAVLNYSPGPVDTPMIEELVDNMKDEQVRGVFVDMKENKTILTTFQTVEKLLSILVAGDYKSGDVIDYYDRI